MTFVMRHGRCWWGLLLGLVLGCAHHRPMPPVSVVPAPFQQFVSRKFDWSTVKRVVLMPVANQSAYEHAAVEIQQNLAAELQRAGCFDIVVANRDDPGANARDIFAHGQFDEIELLRLARQYDAQAVLFGIITQYEPWAPPRLGLSLLMISPAEGVAIASTDGLWDAREFVTARQAQAYLQNDLSWKQSLLGVDRVLESPDVYQRFVCQQIASSLHPPDMTGMPPSIPAPDGLPIPPPPAIMPAGAVQTPKQDVIQADKSLPP